MIEKLGIDSVGEFIAFIICLVGLGLFWVLIGGGVCPKSIKKRWLRIIISIFWPVYLIIMFLLLPFFALYDITTDEEKDDTKEHRLSKSCRWNSTNRTTGQNIRKVFLRLLLLRITLYLKALMKRSPICWGTTGQF